MFWINDEHELNQHTAPLCKWAYLATSRLFLMFLLVFPYHSYGFDRGDEPGGDVGASVGGSVGGGSIGGGSFSGSIDFGFDSSGSSSKEIDEIIVTAPPD